MQKFDIIFIGGGPGGYVGALYAAKKGLKVALVEEKDLGGTCLNKGCIPTKTLLSVSHQIDDLKKSNNSGFISGDIKINYSKIIKRKDDIVLKLRSGIEILLKARAVNLFRGRAVLGSKNIVNINNESIEGNNIVIATGSSPKKLDSFIGFGDSILTSDELVSLSKLPESLLVVGGGAIGLEYADMFSGFGVKVILVELMERIIPNMEKELGIKLEQILKRKGIEIYTKTGIEESRKNDGKIEVKLSNGKNFESEKVLVSVGREPNIKNIGLESLGIKIEKNSIAVDSYLRTNLSNIYAIGDAKGGMMLAHTASHEAMMAVDNILGKKLEMDYSSIPNCIYTEPEAASFGMKEEEVKGNPDIKTAKFPLTSLGKAHAISKEEGFVKIIFDKNTYKIKGAHILAHNASDLISELALAKKSGLTLNNLKETVHPHPTLSESIMETALMGLGEGIHVL